MKAWKMISAGAPDVLQLTDIEQTLPAEGEVLLRVCAAGFNPIDTKIRAGIAPIAPHSGVLGCDVSGIVEAVGPGVTAFAVGDAVYGLAGGVKGMQGALAETMITDAALLAHAPVSVPLSDAAALPVAAATAFQLAERLRIQTGDRVFVVGASGAVGMMITQLAVLNGAEVTGSAGDDKRKRRVVDFGGTAVLHSDATGLTQQFTKVVDTFGGPGLQTALMMAEPEGQVATINARGEHELAPAHAKALTLHAIFSLLPLLNGHGRERIGRQLAELAKLIDDGKLKSLPVEAVGMKEVANVHARYERGALTEKTVLLADF